MHPSDKTTPLNIILGKDPTIYLQQMVINFNVLMIYPISPKTVGINEYIFSIDNLIIN